MHPKLRIEEKFEFSNDERELLCAQLKLSILAPDNYPISAELKDKALRAAKEDSKVKKMVNHFEARAEQQHLVERCGVKNINEDIKNQLDDLEPLESLLLDQLTALHKASMSLLSKIYNEDGFEFESGEKFINLSNKLMRTYQSGLQTLSHIKNSGKQTIVVKHQNVQVNGGQAIVANEINSGPRGGDKNDGTTL